MAFEANWVIFSGKLRYCAGWENPGDWCMWMADILNKCTELHLAHHNRPADRGDDMRLHVQMRSAKVIIRQPGVVCNREDAEAMAEL